MMKMRSIALILKMILLVIGLKKRNNKYKQFIQIIKYNKNFDLLSVFEYIDKQTVIDKNKKIR